MLFKQEIYVKNVLFVLRFSLFLLLILGFGYHCNAACYHQRAVNGRLARPWLIPVDSPIFGKQPTVPISALQTPVIASSPQPMCSCSVVRQILLVESHFTCSFLFPFFNVGEVQYVLFRVGLLHLCNILVTSQMVCRYYWNLMEKGGRGGYVGRGGEEKNQRELNEGIKRDGIRETTCQAALDYIEKCPFDFIPPPIPE